MKSLNEMWVTGQFCHKTLNLRGLGNTSVSLVIDPAHAAQFAAIRQKQLVTVRGTPLPMSMEEDDPRLHLLVTQVELFSVQKEAALAGELVVLALRWRGMRTKTEGLLCCQLPNGGNIVLGMNPIETKWAQHNPCRLQGKAVLLSVVGKGASRLYCDSVVDVLDKSVMWPKTGTKALSGTHAEPLEQQLLDALRKRRTISVGLRRLVFDRDGYRCKHCGASPRTSPNCELHVDHVHPVAKGGSNEIENLQTLCRDCNIAKGVMPDPWGSPVPQEAA
jgi:hypothetical protein